MVALLKSTSMMSIQMTSPQEWITTIIIIIVTEQPMNTTPIIKKTSKATNMEPELAQPMEMATNTPKILQKITKKR